MFFCCTCCLYSVLPPPLRLSSSPPLRPSLRRQSNIARFQDDTEDTELEGSGVPSQLLLQEPSRVPLNMGGDQDAPTSSPTEMFERAFAFSAHFDVLLAEFGGVNSGTSVNDSLDDVLLDIAMYQYPPLVENALDMMVMVHTQREQLMHAFVNAQLLVTEHHVRTYREVRGRFCCAGLCP